MGFMATFLAAIFQRNPKGIQSFSPALERSDYAGCGIKNPATLKGLNHAAAGQEEHHRKVSFQDEFRQLLRRYEIEFDERYVWD